MESHSSTSSISSGKNSTSGIPAMQQVLTRNSFGHIGGNVQMSQAGQKIKGKDKVNDLAEIKEKSNRTSSIQRKPAVVEARPSFVEAPLKKRVTRSASRKKQITEENKKPDVPHFDGTDRLPLHQVASSPNDFMSPFQTYPSHEDL